MGKKKRKVNTPDCDDFQELNVEDDPIFKTALVAAADSKKESRVDAIHVLAGKKEKLMKKKLSEVAEAEEEITGVQEGEKADPYLLAGATYIQKDTRWRNKQRTLVFSNRGPFKKIVPLINDFKQLLPHHKTDCKYERKSSISDIKEIAELQSCNNVLYIESIKKAQFVYLYLGRVPLGPTVKFQVHSVHSTWEPRLAGNCLLGSRAILHFDKVFSHVPFLKVIKTLLIQVIGTPRNHPKSKPFHDHIMNFFYVDKKIWFRHYQIAPETPFDRDNPEGQQLTEIGPRFMLEPIRIFEGAFCGKILCANGDYLTPTARRVIRRSNPTKMPKEENRFYRKVSSENKLRSFDIPDEDELEDVFL